MELIRHLVSQDTECHSVCAAVRLYVKFMGSFHQHSEQHCWLLY